MTTPHACQTCGAPAVILQAVCEECMDALKGIVARRLHYNPRFQLVRIEMLDAGPIKLYHEKNGMASASFIANGAPSTTSPGSKGGAGEHLAPQPPKTVPAFSDIKRLARKMVSRWEDDVPRHNRQDHFTSLVAELLIRVEAIERRQGVGSGT